MSLHADHSVVSPGDTHRGPGGAHSAALPPFHLGKTSTWEVSFPLFEFHFSNTLIFFKRIKERSCHCDAVEMNLTSNQEVVGLIPALAQWVKDPVLL